MKFKFVKNSISFAIIFFSMLSLAQAQTYCTNTGDGDITTNGICRTYTIGTTNPDAASQPKIGTMTNDSGITTSTSDNSNNFSILASVTLAGTIGSFINNSDLHGLFSTEGLVIAYGLIGELNKGLT